MIKKYKENEIDELAKILINDGVICVPTDTVYGLCARINSKKAYEKLIEIKKRPLNKLFPIMCADEEQVRSIAIVNNKAEKIIKAFVPGPLTLILEKKEGLPIFINNLSNTIAVRMATSNVLEELIRKVQTPIFMTSANISGEPVCKSIKEIETNCPLLDGIMEGDIPQGIASTIVDCTSDEIKILREGPISIDQIKEALDSKKIHENMNN